LEEEEAPTEIEITMPFGGKDGACQKKKHAKGGIVLLASSKGDGKDHQKLLEERDGPPTTT